MQDREAKPSYSLTIEVSNENTSLYNVSSREKDQQTHI